MNDSSLRSCERPVVAPGWIVDQLRAGEDDAGLYSQADESAFSKGDAVEIINGPFFDRRGIFDGLNDNQRVAVLLDIMGRQVKTLVPLAAVRLVG